MIETTDDKKIAQILGNKMDGEVEYLGIGVFGKNEEVLCLSMDTSDDHPYG